MMKKRRIKILTELLDKAYIKNVYNILDIGCGEGSLTKIIGEYCGTNSIFGIDYNSVACEKARKKGLKIYCLDVEKEKLPFPDDYFDVILMLRIIAHLRNPDNVLREVQRCLRTEGVLLLSTINCTSWINRLLVLFGYPPLNIDLSTEWRYQYPLGVTGVISGHVRLYTLDSLKKLLGHHGLNVINARGIRVSWIKTDRNAIIDLIDSVLVHRTSLANEIALLIQKKP